MTNFLIKMDFSNQNYKIRNKLVFDYIEGIIEKITFGSVRVDFEVHNKRITSIMVYGRQSIRPKKTAKS